MFSLIVAVVSIALLVALVSLSGYFGGGAITDSQAKAQAAQLAAEHQQIFAGMDIFQADHRRWPVDVPELVTTGYLRSIPRGIEVSDTRASAVQRILELIPSAHAAPADPLGWSMPKASTPIIFTGTRVPKQTCQQFNLKARGDDGILRQPYANLLAQCYGQDGAYRVLVRKVGYELDDTVASSTGPVVVGALPGKDSSSGWDAPPSGTPGSTGPETPVDPEKPGEAPAGSMTAVSFGGVPAGTSATGSTTLRNIGDVSLTLGSFIVSGEGFSLASTTCSSTLEVGASCSVSVTFTAAGTKTYAGAVSIQSSQAGAVSAALSGQSLMSRLEVSPAAVAIAGQIGTPVTSPTVHTLRNTGNIPITGLDLDPPNGFSVQNSSCTTTLAAGAYCQFRVQFAPTALELYGGPLTITGTPADAVQVGVSGSIETPTATLTDINFGVRSAGYTSISLSTLQNTGSVTLTLVTPSADSVKGTGFTFSSTTCGTTLAPNQKCYVRVQSVAPAAGTEREGQLTVVTSAGDKVAKLHDSAIIQKITYTVGQVAAGVTGGDGANGNATTVTFAGRTIVAGGGRGGYNNTGVSAAGGEFSGDADGGKAGGSGAGASGGYGGGGGGAIGGSNGFIPTGTLVGGAGAAPTDVGGLQAAILAAGKVWGVPGSGGASGIKGGDSVGYGAGAGGAGGGLNGKSGGEANQSSFGGGGGGGSSIATTSSVSRGGHGGPGAVVLQFVDGSSVVLTTGTTYTATGKTIQTIWAIGGGGSGGGTLGRVSAAGGGGGAGAVAYMVFNEPSQ